MHRVKEEDLDIARNGVQEFSNAVAEVLFLLLEILSCGNLSTKWYESGSASPSSYGLYSASIDFNVFGPECQLMVGNEDDKKFQL